MRRLALVAFLLVPILAACAAAGTRYSVQEDGLEQTFERVQGAVVTIYTAGRSGLVDRAGEATLEEGIGAGVLIDAEGHVLTASHVVQTADAVVVQFLTGDVVAARVVSSVPVADVALLQLVGPLPDGVRPAPLGDSDPVRVASRVFVVGAPLGISHTLTVGYVSARRVAPSLLRKDLQVEVFQTDAAVNRGNSGGPMFNLRGEVIGIVSYIVSQSGGSEGLGFAITSNTARRLLLEQAPFWSGVDYVIVEGPLAEALNVPEGRAGLLLQRVAANSPGDRLGLRGGAIAAEIEGVALLLGGDILIEAFGQAIGAPDGIERAIAAAAQLQPDATVRVRLVRAGKLLQLEAKLSEVVPGSKKG